MPKIAKTLTIGRRLKQARTAQHPVPSAPSPAVDPGPTWSVEWRDPAELQPYPQNPRETGAAIAAVAASIRAFGFQQPIVVDADGVIVVGHVRWLAAQQLGLARVPVHVAADLAPDQIRAYRVADNKTHDLATWHLERLTAELQWLPEIDWAPFGFNEAELAAHFAPPGQFASFDPRQEWQGMPEYQQRDARSFAWVKVHFATAEAREAFLVLLGENPAHRHKSVWYPHRDPEPHGDI